jgi:rod shape-determining protein MreC
MWRSFLLFSNRVQARRWLIVVGTGLFLILLRATGVSDNFTQWGHRRLQPLLQFNVRVMTDAYQSTNNFKTWKTTARRVQDLELKLAHAQAQLSQLDQLQAENSELRQLLNSSDRNFNQVTITRPIVSLAQPAIFFDQSFGGQPLVRVGAPVLVKETLVGLVSKIDASLAYISLLWQEETPLILVETQTGVQGILRGNGKYVLLTEVPTDQELIIGERVTTTGQEGIEQGLYVGEIQSIQSGHSSAVKTAIIQQYVSFYETALVEVR